MLTDQNVEMLKACKTEKEWNDACTAIKKEHKGYPADWFPRVILSGLMEQILGAGASKIQVVPIT